MTSVDTVETTGLPYGRELTVEDLESLPDDGHRYELIDGTLFVTPAPGWAHQEAVVRLGSLLLRHAPPEAVVLVAPFAIRLGRHTEVQPDVLVARRADMTATHLPVAPVLAVEVQSRSTALLDLNTKKSLYEREGTPSYWLLDPRQARLTVLELDADGRYVEVGTAVGAETLSVTRPFTATLCPTDLLGGAEV